VRIRVGEVISEGSGAGHGIDADLGHAHESAIKEAETDAMKRALMTFGNPLPANTPSIADRICQRRHCDWIEAFLVSHREVRSGDQHRELRSAVQHQTTEAS